MKIRKEKLEKLYNSKSSKEVCSILGISPPTLLKIIKANYIIPKGKGNRSKRSPIVDVT